MARTPKNAATATNDRLNQRSVANTVGPFGPHFAIGHD
jgi:hypothetical protein